VAEYVAKHQAAKVTERLNALYGAQPSTLAEPVRRVQPRTVRGREW